ncbi:CarD family transcriptional regulator [Methylocystis parvus]|uniref:CarD family transcriptional regulator n=1 Tax=Methylocystis parvus TaxID=134 RepID=UPI003C748D59
MKNAVVTAKAPVPEAKTPAATAPTPKVVKPAAAKAPQLAQAVKPAEVTKLTVVPKPAEPAKAPAPAKAPEPAKAAASTVSKIVPATAPAATVAAPKPARDITPASPASGAAQAASAAAGKTSSTTTAGEDKKLAKRNEPPVTTATPVAAEKTAIDTRVAAKPAPAPAKAKPATPKHGFKLNEFIVYPAHGVGQIVGVETQEVAGFSLELFVVSFIKDKMILKVPTSKVGNVGMRKLAEGNVVDKALNTLSGRARIKRTMWSRRAQEYEAKINSGDLVTIAEVVRDLYRSDTQPEQSYSERQLYEAALDRMAREVAAVRKLIDSEALKLIESFLQKGPRRGQKTDADVADEADEEDVDRAA